MAQAAISGLTAGSSLNDNSLIEVSRFNGVNDYTSQKFTLLQLLSFIGATPWEITVKNFTPASGTNTTNEEILQALLVPASTVASGDIIEVLALVAQNSSAGTKTYRMYINTIASLSGAVQIASTAGFTTNANSHSFYRPFPVISATSLFVWGGANSSIASIYTASTGTSANITVPNVTSAFYIIITGQKSTGTDTDTVNASWVRISKSAT
jgi:hypothetical protein